MILLISHIILKKYANILIGQCACFEDTRVLKGDRSITPLDSLLAIHVQNKPF